MRGLLRSVWGLSGNASTSEASPQLNKPVTSLPTTEMPAAGISVVGFNWPWPSTGRVTHTLRVDGLPQKVETLDRRLKAFWELEAFGISDSEHSVYDKFEETVPFKDGRYKVALRVTLCLDRQLFVESDSITGTALSFTTR